MDDELLARFHGYTQWAVQMHWNMQEATMQKQEFFVLLQQHKDVPEIFLAQKENIKALLQKKQLPHGEALVAVFHDIKESQKELYPLFEGMHTALFVGNIANTIEQMYDYVMMLFDQQQRQLRILNGISSQTAEDLLPHLFFLYKQEKNVYSAMRETAQKIEENRKKIVTHMHENYMKRLQKLHKDASFREDHREVLQSAYLLSISGTIFAHLYGISQKENKYQENEFLNAIASF